MTKHHKTSTLSMTFYGAVDETDLDTLHNFDDRTLSGLAGSMIGCLSDGVDNDNPYRALPLERWADVPFTKAERVRGRDR